jgi:hypothetical protein
MKMKKWKSQERYEDTWKNERKKDVMYERYDRRKRKTATNTAREEEGGSKLYSEMEQQWRTWWLLSPVVPSRAVATAITEASHTTQPPPHTPLTHSRG